MTIPLSARSSDRRATRGVRAASGRVSIYFICEDALAIYREVVAKGVRPENKPFVGNGMRVASFFDPDGYKLLFESPTDAPEETGLEDSTHQR